MLPFSTWLSQRLSALLLTIYLPFSGTINFNPFQKPLCKTPNIVPDKHSTIRAPMLRVTPSTSPDGAKRYFGEGLSRDAYYMEVQEIAGLWGGKAAERLGLSGQVEAT